MKNMSLNKRISLIVLVMVILSTAIVGIFSYLFYRRDSIAVSADKALAIAQSVASAVDGGQFQEIMLSGEKSEYWYAKKQYVDEVMTRTGVAYLYLLDKNYDENVRYFMEAAPLDGSDSIDLCEEESIEFHADELFETLTTGKPTVTGIYSAEDYGMMVSGFAPILGDGKTVGVVGIDISINDVMAASNVFAIVIVACVVACSFMFWLISHLYIKRKIGMPITVLSDAAGMLSKGNMNIKLSINSGDEIGTLTAAFLDIVDSTEKQIAVLESLADGDLTVDVTPRSDMDSMSFAIKKTISNLNNMFSEINNTATEVAHGSGQIANGAQLLAQGAMEQTTALGELSASLSDITQKNDDSTELAGKAAKLAGAIILNAEKGSHQMNEMTNAVEEINKASQQIKKVIKVIDDIAFQTNILALNAAVEAARAGQHGKGFAVVAEEVRNLASKSAEAAKDTEGLIADSVTKAELGSRIASETAASLVEIVTEINESNKLIMDIVGSSKEQAKAIAHINKGIEQVSQVVERNNASATESASASEEMNAQAGALEGLVARFKLN